MIKKPLKNILKELLALNLPLWMQVAGMSSALCFDVVLFSFYQPLLSNEGVVILISLELLIILFSVSTFSIYLTKKGFRNAKKLGLRKTLGASGGALFIEVAVLTTLLMLLSIIISIGIMDVSTRFVGLSFESMLKSIGVIHFGVLLLLVFLVSEGVMFIIIGVSLAPTLKSSITETIDFEEYWFEKLEKFLSKTSLFLLLIITTLLIVLILNFSVPSPIIILAALFFCLLLVWYLFNKYLIPF